MKQDQEHLKIVLCVHVQNLLPSPPQRYLWAKRLLWKAETYPSKYEQKESASQNQDDWGLLRVDVDVYAESTTVSEKKPLVQKQEDTQQIQKETTIEVPKELDSK